jgi:multisubunit Na+/H+ antiporter MnhC subunit
MVVTASLEDTLSDAAEPLPHAVVRTAAVTSSAASTVFFIVFSSFLLINIYTEIFIMVFNKFSVSAISDH